MREEAANSYYALLFHRAMVRDARPRLTPYSGIFSMQVICFEYFAKNGQITPSQLTESKDFSA
jgi:hypothetical protein